MTDQQTSSSPHAYLPPDLVVTVRVNLDASTPRFPTSWSITHGIGTPAQNTYTEVVLPDVLPDDVRPGELVRHAAFETYGRAWAFDYRPEQFDECVGRWGARRRERIVVEVSR